eukprot:752113-Hanusia_phi.AAC.1
MSRARRARRLLPAPDLLIKVYIFSSSLRGPAPPAALGCGRRSLAARHWRRARGPAGPLRPGGGDWV